MGLRDFNILPPNYLVTEDNSAVEVNSEIAELIQQMNVLFFTNRGELLNMPDYGCNLSDYLFKTNYNEDMVEADINDQMKRFVNTTENVTYELSVKFLTWEKEVCMEVDVDIKNLKTNEGTVMRYYA
jgi:phage baseplate assembly protein W